MASSTRVRISLLGVAIVAAAGVAWLAMGSPAAAGPAAGAPDWSQWLGPKRDNISTETGWSTDWPADGPKVLWRKKVGAGYSAVSVANGLAYTMGIAGGKDTVWCFKADTGVKVWEKSYACGKGDHAGPRCTPTVDGSVVYTLSYYGHLNCYNAKSGAVVWSKDLGKELGVRPPRWGFACSPLLDGDRLIVDVGMVVALNKKTGDFIWKGNKTKAGYSSPALLTVRNRKFLAVFSATSIRLLDAAGGQELAAMPWKTNYDVNAATPVVMGDKLFVTSGYGRGHCALLQVTDRGLREVWSKSTLKSQFSTGVFYKGYLYGIHGNVGGTSLKCVVPATGEVKWTQRMGKMAALMMADGKLIVSTDPGELIVCKADPAGYQKLCSAKLGVKNVWTMPVLSGGRIFVRGFSGDLVCVSVKAK